jgi:micrococcal nuclease
MKRLIHVTVFFLLLFSCLAFNVKAKEYVVTKVIDGDTVMLDSGEIVRYLGIDAPPIKKSEGGPQFYAREAARQNKSLVLLKKVRLEFDVNKKDAEGRLLAYVYVKDTFVNGELVRLGCARAAVKPPDLRYRDLLLKYQKDASKRCAGLWQEDKQETGPYYVGNKRSHVFHRPSCPLSNRIPEKSRIVFRTRADPISIGYVPCRKCKP